MNPEKLYIQDPLDIKKKFKKFIIITGCFNSVSEKDTSRFSMFTISSKIRNAL